MIEVKDLTVKFQIPSSRLFGKETLTALENADFTVSENEVIGLAGESGSGKSTLGKAMLQLVPASGEVIYSGKNLIQLKRKELLPLRKDLQIIFQDPYSSMNPRFTVFEILTEGLKIHSSVSPSEAKEKAESAMEKVGLKKEHLERYPHEFSGGQRQRICIARTLILNPKFIVCDEITSALDVSNQAQIINLLTGLKRETGISLLFISHDLGVLGHISDRIAVMYLGRIVELGSREEIRKNPAHPYTRALFSSIFSLGGHRKSAPVTGEIPSVLNKPKGCYFHTRCPEAKDICRNERPAGKEVSKGHFSECHFS
ncbi:MAG TPA: ABC transporter ATP-binding protein [Leptospiraceae bacterium]|nr:ABC transporter ATP-binding protein [Leptospiraceae bacterium]